MKGKTLIAVLVGLTFIVYLWTENTSQQEIIVDSKDHSIDEREVINQLVLEQKELKKVSLYEKEILQDFRLDYDPDHHSMTYSNTIQLDDQNNIYYRATKNGQDLPPIEEEAFQNITEYQNMELNGLYGIYLDGNFYFQGSDGEVDYEISETGEGIDKESFIYILDTLEEEKDGSFDPMYSYFSLKGMNFPLVDKGLYDIDAISFQYGDSQERSLVNLNVTYKHKEKGPKWHYYIGDSIIHKPDESWEQKGTEKLSNGRKAFYFEGKTEDGVNIHYYSWKDGDYYYGIRFEQTAPKKKQILSIIESSLTDEEEFSSVELLEQNAIGGFYGEKIYLDELLTK